MAKLRLVVVHATEAYIPLDINQSLSMSGYRLLPEFSYEQVQELAVRHGLDWAHELGTQNSGLPTSNGGWTSLFSPRRSLITWHVRVNSTSYYKKPHTGGIYSHHLRHHPQICKHIRASSSTQTGGYSSAR